MKLPESKIMSDKLLVLNKDKIVAMKAGDRTRKDILIMVINEANNIAKNDPKSPNRDVVDDDVVQALNRTIKKARETKKILEDNGADASAADNEITVAQSYLPQQMTRDELTAKVKEIVEGDTVSKKQRGLVMKTLNESYKGLFDSQMANAVVTELAAVE
jgi:uncharacterized protein YqeY